MIYFFVVRKMSYNWFNRKELLQKAKGRYHNVGGKEKAAEYYLKNRGFNKKNANNKYRSLSEEEEKEAKREYQRNRYKNMKEKLSQKSIKQLKY